MLNVREGCVEGAVNEDLEYGRHNQRLRRQRAASADATLQKTHEEQCRDKCMLESNQIIDIGNLSTFLATKTACRPCANRAAVQLALNFAEMLDADKGMQKSLSSGPSYCYRLKWYLRTLGGNAAAVNIPSFSPVAESNQGFSSTIHLGCSGAVHSCDLEGDHITIKSLDGVLRKRSRFAAHHTELSLLRCTSLTLQLRWPRHPRSAVDVDKEATGQSGHQTNVQMVAAMLHLGKGGKDAVNLATLLGIPISGDWGKNTFPGIARHYGRNAETLASHVVDVNLATEIRMAMAAGIKPELVGGAEKRSEDKEAVFSEAFLPLWDVLVPLLAVGIAAVSAAKELELTSDEFGWFVRVPISIDMGWQKRSLGRHYDSRTGLETAIGGWSGLLIDYVVMSNNCCKCDAVRRKGKIPTATMKSQHDCQENHFGKTSKAMEATAAVMLQN